MLEVALLGGSADAGGRLRRWAADRLAELTAAPDLRQIRTSARQNHEDDYVKAIYPDNSDGDREAHPQAVPGLHPETEGAVDVTSLTLEVDGEIFALRANEFGGTDYTWLSGPNPGYGFSVSPTPNLSLDEHMENIYDFLATVDPTTGYIEDDKQ